MVNVLQSLGTLALFAVFMGFFTFCLLYHVLADWRATPMGRHMMSFMMVCNVIVTYAYVNTAFFPPTLIAPPSVPRALVRLVLYSALGAVVWWRIRLLITMQIEGRNERTLLEARKEADGYTPGI